MSHKSLQFRLKNLSVIVALFLIAIVVARCGGDKKTSTSIQPTFTSIYSTILSQACIQCHVPSGVPYGSGVLLDFTSKTTAYTTLTTKVASGPTSGAACTTNNISIISAGSPSNSFLMGVLFTSYWGTNFAGVGCTPYNAHLSDQALGSAEKAALEQWITSGAANN